MPKSGFILMEEPGLNRPGLELALEEATAGLGGRTGSRNP
jgi:hypothetical protein